MSPPPAVVDTAKPVLPDPPKQYADCAKDKGLTNASTIEEITAAAVKATGETRACLVGFLNWYRSVQQLNNKAADAGAAPAKPVKPGKATKPGV